MFSGWEIRFALEKTWHYRKSTMTILSLDLSKIKGLRSSSREEQITAYLTACFGLPFKLRKQKTCNTYFPPKKCPLLLISSLLPAAAAQLGHEQPCPTLAVSSQHHLSFSSWLQRCSTWAVPTEGEEMFSWRCSPCVTHSDYNYSKIWDALLWVSAWVRVNRTGLEFLENFFFFQKH